MNRGEINERLDQSLDWDAVREAFIEHWTMSFFLGEVTYFQLVDESYICQTNAECFAFILIGVARVLSMNVGDCPDDAYQYYEAACKALEGAPGYVSSEDLTVRIIYPAAN